MTGFITGVDYSQLFASSVSSTQVTNSMLATLYSGGSTNLVNAGVSTGNPLTDLKLAQANKTADIARAAKQPQVLRDIQAFTNGLAKAKTIQDALRNPNVMKVLLTANNLARYIQYPALAQKALLSDPSQANALVNRLSDSNLLAATKTFNFATTGMTTLRDPKVLASLTNGYAEVLWRQSLEKATPGLSNALAFLTQASAVKQVDDILGNSVNRDVVLTALGIPPQVAFQELRAQEQAVTSRLDVSKLQDPKFVRSLTDQYLLTKQRAALATSGGSATLSALAVQARGLVV